MSLTELQGALQLGGHTLPSSASGIKRAGDSYFTAAAAGAPAGPDGRVHFSPIVTDIDKNGGRCPHTEAAVADAERVKDQADWDPSHLTDEEVEIMREATAILKRLDSDRDGKLSYDEFRVAMRSSSLTGQLTWAGIRGHSVTGSQGSGASFSRRGSAASERAPGSRLGSVVEQKSLEGMVVGEEGGEGGVVGVGMGVAEQQQQMQQQERAWQQGVHAVPVSA